MPVSIIPYIYFFCNRFSGKLLNLIKIKMIRYKKMLNLYKDVDIIYRMSCSKKQKVRKQIKGILEKDA